MNTFNDAIKKQNLKTLSEEENKSLDKFLENFNANVYKWQRDIIELVIANGSIQVMMPRIRGCGHYTTFLLNEIVQEYLIYKKIKETKEYD